MKHLIIIFLALLTFEAVGQTSSKGRTDWGPWNQHPCFKGLSFRFRCLGLAVSINKYEYAMQVKNDYPVRVSYIADCSEEGRNITNNVYPGGGLFGTNLGAITNIPPWYDAAEGHYINSGVILFRSVCFIEKGGCSYYCYAQCDERPKVPNQPGCNKKTNTNTNSNQNNQTSTVQTNAEIDNINQYLTKIGDNDTEKQRIIRELVLIIGSTTLTDGQKAARIKTLTGQAKIRAEQLDSQESARKAEEERQRKIEEERHSTMRTYTKQGDDAYNSGQYANAKMYYSSALTYATNDYDKQQIQAAISRAQLAIEAEARKQRVEQKQKVERETNTAAAGAIAGGIGVLALLQDEESDEFFSAKFRFGLGIEWVPLLTNSSMKQTTRTDILAPYMISAGFKLVVGNNKPVSAHFTPEGGYGLMAFSTGKDGYMYSFGGMAGIHAGLKQESAFKLVGEAGYIKRGGSYNYDGDVASGGTTATDDVYNGEFKYGITRLGGGVLFQVHDFDEIRFFIKPMYYFDKFSFAKRSPFTKILGIQLGSTKFGIVDLMYSSGYGIGGTIDYPQSFAPSRANSWIISTERESYFQIRYSRQVKIT